MNIQLIYNECNNNVTHRIIVIDDSFEFVVIEKRILHRANTNHMHDKFFTYLKHSVKPKKRFLTKSILNFVKSLPSVKINFNVLQYDTIVN